MEAFVIIVIAGVMSFFAGKDVQKRECEEKVEMAEKGDGE